VLPHSRIIRHNRRTRKATDFGAGVCLGPTNKTDPSWYGRRCRTNKSKKGHYTIRLSYSLWAPPCFVWWHMSLVHLRGIQVPLAYSTRCRSKTHIATQWTILCSKHCLWLNSHIGSEYKIGSILSWNKSENETSVRRSPGIRVKSPLWVPYTSPFICKLAVQNVWTENKMYKLKSANPLNRMKRLQSVHACVWLYSRFHVYSNCTRGIRRKFSTTYVEFVEVL